MKTLSEIQATVRALARDEGLVLTADSGFELANLSIRRLASLYQWEDFTHVDSKLVTVAGQAEYSWPSRMVYQDILSVEVEDQDDFNRFKRVVPVRSELQWEEARWEQPDLPRVYRFYDPDADNDTHIELRPAPKYGSKVIRITGVKEPFQFETSESSTPFRVRIMDDLLSYIIAANVCAMRAQQARAQQLATEAATIIRDLTGKEIIPSEIYRSGT